MKNNAVTLVEVLVGISILSITAGVMALNSSTVGQQSAQKEAERVAAFLQGHIIRENIARRGLWFQVNENNILVGYGAKHDSQQIQHPDFKANTGCKYSPAMKLFYNIVSQSSRDNALNAGWNMIDDDSTIITDSTTNGRHYITIQGADKKFLNVIIGRTTL